MNPETIRSAILDGIIQLVDMDDCPNAIERWRDVMEILRKCSKSCQTVSHKLDHGLCALCLECALREETARSEQEPHEIAKYQRAADGLRGWMGRFDAYRMAAND